MTQNELILAHLKKGKTLTRLQAMLEYGVGNLPARIHELRASDEVIRNGLDIITERKKSRSGGTHVAYRLVKKEGEGVRQNAECLQKPLC